MVENRRSEIPTLNLALHATWFSDAVVAALANTARDFAARFRRIADDTYLINAEATLAITNANAAIIVRVPAAAAEDWVTHNILTDLTRALLRRLQSIAPDRDVTLVITRAARVLVTKAIRLDASAPHLVLDAPEHADLLNLGSGGAAFLEKAKTAPSHGGIAAGPGDRPAVTVAESSVLVHLHYATERAPIGVADGSATWFGIERGDVRFGIAEVRVPRDRKIGSLDRRKKWYELVQFDADARTHIHSVTELDENSFYTSLSRAVGAAARRRAFLFVHGYNVSFDQAAARAAQLHVDLRFDGVPILYSWPSAGVWDAYFRDGATIEASRHTFADIVRRVIRDTAADELHILAHSMGSRAVARALEQLAVEALQRGPVVTQLIFAAPDVDAWEMRNMLPHLSRIARRVTIYGSSKDWPITFSEFLAGCRRAGDGGADLLVLPACADSIDVTDIDTTFLAHSYIAENRSLIADMATLLEHNEAPERRLGINRRNDGGWSLQGSYQP